MAKAAQGDAKKAGSNGPMIAALSTVGALAAGALTRRSLRVTWKAVTGEAPPDDPQSKETDIVVAVLWAVATGAAIGVARLLVERELIGRISGHDEG